MPFGAFALTCLAFVAGAAISAQAPINAMLGARLGHPLGAASLSFIVGTLALVTLTLATVRHEVAWGNISSLPPLLWLGGILGAIYVTLAIVLTPKLGVGAVIALGIAGQVAASLAIDHFGLFGLAVREMTIGRASGALFVIAGALMVRFL